METAGTRTFAAPEFDTLVERVGLEIFDPVEKVRFELWTPDSIDPEEADTDPFAFPLDSAVEFSTSQIEIPKLADVFIRERDGEYIGQYSTASDQNTFTPWQYLVELTTTPLKLYLLVESGLEIQKTGEHSVVVDFGEETTVRVGARSFHEQPAGQVTITDDPEDLLNAISLFGAALKTTSPERSFPTLRGHPPRLKLGKEFQVSRGLDNPKTGVTLVVPPKRRAIAAASSLAYYLGAELVAGSPPRLIAGGVDYELPQPATDLGWSREADDFEREVNQLLKQIFFLDCLTRTEGFYQFDLYEREALESDLDLDFAHLYDQSIPTQLDAYLDVPFETIRPYVPTWNLLVDVVPTPENLELLPYVVDDLALIRCSPPPEKRILRPEGDLADEYTTGRERRAYRELQSKPGADDPEVHDMSFAGKPFMPWPTRTVEHAYVGDGYPEGANKLMLEGFENQLDAEHADDSTINVHVVVNDPLLARKGILSHVYNDRNLIDIDVSYDQLVSPGELAAILEQPLDFFHFVGEVTPNGFGCPGNEFLKPYDVYPMGAKSFFLTGGTSYADAEWLIKRGSFGGVVAPEIEDGDDALVMGRWMARLLSQGFTLRSAASVVENVRPSQMEYCVLGDGGVSLVQSESSQPFLVDIESINNDLYETILNAYPTNRWEVGSYGSANHGIDGPQHLTPGKLPAVEMNRDDLIDYLESEVMPIHIDGEYGWSDLLQYSRNL